MKFIVLSAEILKDELVGEKARIVLEIPISKQRQRPKNFVKRLEPADILDVSEKILNNL